MDPASFGLTVAATVVLAVQVSTALADYIESVKGASETWTKLRAEVKSLGEILNDLQGLVDECKRTGDDGTLLKVADVDSGPVSQCKNTLQKLHDWLRGELTTRGRLRFPFWREKKIKEALAAIQRHKSTFNLAIVADLRYA